MAATLRDCIYGQAVGDALGVPYEFMARGSFECTGMVGYGSHGQPAGTWSDDTSMALAICDSYRELGRISCPDIRERFSRWYNSGSYTVNGLFDCGGTCARAIVEGRGLGCVWDNGNGSLMRTMPLVFTCATVCDVEDVSAITHAHETSKGACVKAVEAGRALRDGASPVEAAEAIGYGYVAELPKDDVRSGGYVLETLEAALWCLISTDGYAPCVLAAVNLGGDTGTTAAVAGSLAGIVYGMDSIPAGWMDALLGKDLIESCMF